MFSYYHYILIILKAVWYELRSYIWGGEPLDFKYKIILAVIGVIIIFVLANLRQDFLIKIYKFNIVVCLIILIVPVVMINLMSLPKQKTLDFSSKIFNENPENIVFIVFDETSPEYANQYVDVLKQAGLTILENTEVEAAGKNTINAIPAMLTGKKFDDTVVCSSNSLCGINTLRWSSLEATDKNTDIVGFYRPYCEIKGLRGCYRQKLTSIHSLWCILYNKADILGSFCNCNEKFDFSRFNMQVDQQKFWREGGSMYLHYLLPHPTNYVKHKDLKSEYEYNIKIASKILNDLSTKLKTKFQDNFVIVVTSDHPLRAESIWCKNPDYEQANCLADLPVNRGKVPFIVASPLKLSIGHINTNVGILSP